MTWCCPGCTSTAPRRRSPPSTPHWPTRFCGASGWCAGPATSTTATRLRSREPAAMPPPPTPFSPASGVSPVSPDEREADLSGRRAVRRCGVPGRPMEPFRLRRPPHRAVEFPVRQAGRLVARVGGFLLAPGARRGHVSPPHDLHVRARLVGRADRVVPCRESALARGGQRRAGGARPALVR